MDNKVNITNEKVISVAAACMNSFVFITLSAGLNYLVFLYSLTVDLKPAVTPVDLWGVYMFRILQISATCS